ncbi:MAG: RidA family protein [Myxococcales bacterium]|jgi:2-iminobutanoate/2-iminopropanoate deaminase|nr:RidA family protein [Myxococcales bacterium]
MNRRIITTAHAPQAIGPYSQAVQTDQLLFVSGQLGLPPDGAGLVPGGVAAQTARALDNVKAILEAAGLSLGHVVKTTILLVDMADFPVVNDIYASYFPEAPPARATYAVAGLPLGALIEIEAIATRS